MTTLLQTLTALYGTAQELENRSYVLTVGDPTNPGQAIQIAGNNGQGLRVKFKVTRDLKLAPNSASIEIYNLAAAHRSALSSNQNIVKTFNGTAKGISAGVVSAVPVQLNAGYATPSLVFLGNLRTGITKQEGSDYVTTVSSGDKEQSMRSARVNVSLAKGTTTGDAFRALVTSLGIGQGNLSQAVAKINASPLGNLFSHGTVLYGSSLREMQNLAYSVGYTWSVQQGALQLLPLTGTLAGTAINVNAATGMIGSPTVDNKGILTVKTLMLPDVAPGRAMVLSSLYLSGQYRIEKTEHHGDFAGTNWYITISGQKY